MGISGARSRRHVPRASGGGRADADPVERVEPGAPGALGGGRCSGQSRQSQRMATGAEGGGIASTVVAIDGDVFVVNGDEGW